MFLSRKKRHENCTKFTTPIKAYSICILFKKGMLNTRLNRINENTIYNTKVTTQTISIQRGDESNSPPQLVEQQDFAEFSISKKSDDTDNKSASSLNFHTNLLTNFPGLSLMSQSNEVKVISQSTSISMDKSMAMDEGPSQWANPNIQEGNKSFANLLISLVGYFKLSAHKCFYRYDRFHVCAGNW